MAEQDDPQYYSHVRREILQFLPSQVDRMLDIGCGRGDTAAWVRQSRDVRHVMGIELDPVSAGQAASQLNEVWCGNFETMDLPARFQEFDLILCLDVLEHLVDPWLAVRRISDMLSPGGTVVASIPNIRYFRVVWDLLARGRWEYQDSGILDRTHLRFFTRQSAQQLMTSSGLVLDGMHATGLERGRKTSYLNAITLSLFQSFFEYQYVIKVRKPAQ